MDNITLKLNSPITEDQWDAIMDVDFDHTDKIWFYTKHGKKVEFIKPVHCRDCKYADEYYNCSYTTWYNSPDDFCSRAGKKGGEE